MKIIATSDLHGYLPEIPECDILLISGDICPIYDHNVDFQFSWLTTNFRTWLHRVPAKKVIFIAGNHDWYFALPENRLRQVNCRNTFQHSHLHMGGFLEKVYYLEDSGCEIDGLKIYGSPWQLRFYDWAFNLDEPELEKTFEKIPKCDILVTHSPPFGCGDLVDDVPKNQVWQPGKKYKQIHNGSKMLAQKCKEHDIKLHVFGHLHKGYGQYKIGNTICANVSLVNEKYQPVNYPMEFNL